MLLLLIGSLVLTAGALVACFRVGVPTAAAVAAIPVIVVVTGLADWALAIAVAPMAGVLAATQISKGMSYGRVVAGASVPGVLAGLFLLLNAGGGAGRRDELVDTWVQQLEGTGIEELAAEGISVHDILSLLLRLQPAIEVVYMLLAVVLGYRLGRLVGLKTGVVVLPEAPPMRQWRLWDQMIWGLVVAGAMLLVTDEGLVNDLALNVVMVALVLYAVQGFSVARFFLWRLQVARLLELAFYAVIFFTSAWAGLALAGVGLMDTWFDWRRLTRDRAQHSEEVD